MNSIRCKVLVIDDIADVRKTLAGTLRDCGYYVESAENETDAKSILRNESFDFIVLDIRLHGHEENDDSGLIFAKTLRKEKIRSKIIFITGTSVKASHIEAVIEYGVIAYVEKQGDWVRVVQNIIEKNFLKFDVFLCHNSEDKPMIRKVGKELIKRGLKPWLDEWELPPGQPWQPLLEQQIEKINSAAVFVGESGLGPWQEVELRAFLSQFVKRGCPVIPVVLRNAPTKPALPLFLSEMMWVDFRKTRPNPIRQLIWGITGKKY